ncbi:prephenate dehydrogenase [Fictibacillus sp. KU28468]|uniref:prephenate dehydrogenase n=1 Tax=Fictibacillus sp. KU28468 TaxID=2991053 RepID=UPI00223DC166|nr:prephenate dehydrogenase [Fictibacillus sp. KU28468]UZJ76943.1 prephenate dehydrogenase [Fictibacillus sp. KU28468]
MNKRVLLIGLGLIGGSIAMAIKKEHSCTIIGHDISADHANLAKRLSIIDTICTDLQKEAEMADLIVLATPVEETERLLEWFSDFNIPPGALITDVGSTKSRIMEKASSMVDKGITFIGGHPMAGSHKSGPGSAKTHLFENAFYMITPGPETPDQRIEELKDWLKGTRAKFIVMDAEKHDLLTGVVSHFPHVVAASLVRQVEHYSHAHHQVNDLAAGGFKDITRIASSSPVMWKDIIKHNKENILTFIDEWIMEMECVKDLVKSGSDQGLLDYFSGAKQYRDALPIKAKGAITSFYDLYVDIIDDVGVISRVTSILAEKKISITNIRVIEAREDIYGVLRVSFQSEGDRQQAKESLEHLQFTTYIAM